MKQQAEPLKQSEIKPCAICGEGLMKNHQLVAYRVKIDTLVFDLGAIRRQHGMEMMMGAAAPLAQHMGPDEDMAKAVTTKTALICMICALTQPMGALIEGDA